MHNRFSKKSRTKNTHKIKTQEILGILMIVFSCIFLLGCDSSSDSKKFSSGKEVGVLPTKETSSTDETKKTDDNYDEKETLIVIEIDKDRSLIKFAVPKKEEYITLNYSGGTMIKNKYKEQLTINQLSLGSLVSVSYTKSTKKAVLIEYIDDYWDYKEVTNVSVSLDSKIIKVGQSLYKFSEDIVVISDNKVIDVSELNEFDVLTLWGIGNEVYSVLVEKGHGYVRFINDEYFIDGMAQIGSKIIKLVTKDMIILAPEGEYTFTISKGSRGGTKDIVVKSNQETVVNLIDLQGEIQKIGTLNLLITPDNAKVLINGKEVNKDDLITLPLGSHRILVSADGYETFAKKITIDSVYINYKVDLLKEGETTATQETTSGTNDSGETQTSEVEGYYIKVTNPEKTDVYFDGAFVGTTPVNFKKVTGTHLITLRKTGYETKTYTVYISDSDEDANLSFSDLIKTEEQ